MVVDAPWQLNCRSGPCIELSILSQGRRGCSAVADNTSTAFDPACLPFHAAARSPWRVGSFLGYADHQAGDVL